MRLFVFIFLFSVHVANVTGQTTFVDKNGIWRWRDSGKEVCAFGVNYTVPFAHAYRTAKRMNVDIEKAIDNDVYHFARLGLDAFRVHVWDTEISDTLGNLIDNEHLRLFDYLIFRMKERGMKFIITPIAYWGNGWPEPDEKTPGFSAKYGKEACLENPDAILAQQRYLEQFVNHVNTYTHIAYKDDPDVLAFEISNEPHHKGTPKQVTGFINGMVKAIRKTGCRKPVFYNVTHSIHLAEAYFLADIQGGTYQWYPTGLGARHSLQGNLLPHVDRYPIPFSGVRGFSRKTKIVYEFDAADCAGSYIYPAIARSFRTAGMQVATHFSYDPSFMAHLNTEYGTHYMNLLYAPHKAIGLMIAAEAFRSVPLFKSYGSYPQNTTFEGVQIKYETDLAELNTDEKFYYTGNTSSQPLHIANLRQIAGTGNSPVVQYDGSGAYFLDKIGNGTWRLEILPDVAWVDDPFGRTSLQKEIACLGVNSRTIGLRLPDLPPDYYIYSVADKRLSGQAENGFAQVRPGVYIVSSSALHDLDVQMQIRNIRLNEYAYSPEVMPALKPDKIRVVHRPLHEISSEKSYHIRALVYAPEGAGVSLHYRINGRYRSLPMKQFSAYGYEAALPGDDLQEGVLEYFITIHSGNDYWTFPDGYKTNPLSWDFYFAQSYKSRIVSAAYPIQLFNPERDHEKILKPWAPSRLMPLPGGGSSWIVRLEKPSSVAYYDSSTRHYYYPMRLSLLDVVQGRSDDLMNKKYLGIRTRTSSGVPLKLSAGLISKHALALGYEYVTDTNKNDQRIAMEQLRKIKLALLPRGYPVFIPYWYDSNINEKDFSLAELENLQLILIIPESVAGNPVEMEIEKIWLE